MQGTRRGAELGVVRSESFARTTTRLGEWSSQERGQSGLLLS